MIHMVIFDLDGVLIDTESIFSMCWLEACHYFGYILSFEQALHLRSLDSQLADYYFKQLFGADCSYGDIRKKRKELMNEYIDKNGVKAKPGANELLRFLKEKKIGTVLATSSGEERALRLLDMAGIDEKFSYIISTSMVKRGKPFPDVYIEACARVNENPRDCIAVEDSPNGIISAFQAGCKVIMVPDLSSPDDEIRRMLYEVSVSLLDIIKMWKEDRIV